MAATTGTSGRARATPGAGVEVASAVREVLPRMAVAVLCVTVTMAGVPRQHRRRRAGGFKQQRTGSAATGLGSVVCFNSSGECSVAKGLRSVVCFSS